MTYPEELEVWFNSHRDWLKSLGVAKCVWGQRRGSERDFCGVYVETAVESIEVLVWRSGQAEFDRGAGDTQTFEHYDLHDSKDLASVLSAVERYLERHESM